MTKILNQKKVFFTLNILIVSLVLCGTVRVFASSSNPADPDDGPVCSVEVPYPDPYMQPLDYQVPDSNSIRAPDTSQCVFLPLVLQGSAQNPSQQAPIASPTATLIPTPTPAPTSIPDPDPYPGL